MTQFTLYLAYDREVPQYCTGHFFERHGPSPSSSLVSDLPQYCTGHGLASASLLILWPSNPACEGKQTLCSSCPRYSTLRTHLSPKLCHGAAEFLLAQDSNRCWSSVAMLQSFFWLVTYRRTGKDRIKPFLLPLLTTYVRFATDTGELK